MGEQICENRECHLFVVTSESDSWSPSLIANAALGVVLGGLILAVLWTVFCWLGQLIHVLATRAAASSVARWERERTEAENCFVEEPVEESKTDQSSFGVSPAR
jgi:hypothetical protein